METIGIIPAAGLAARLGKLPCSKEILPVRFNATTEEIEKPEVLSSHLLKSFHHAGISKIYFILRNGKWDIPAYYGNGSDFGFNIGYLIMRYPYGIPFTLLEALPFVKDYQVALGFPDVWFQPANGYATILQKLSSGKADVVLGAFPVSNPEKYDLIEIDQNGLLSNVYIKEKRPDLRYGWLLSVWRPSFSEYLYQYLKKILNKGGNGRIKLDESTDRELYPGDIFRDAARDGLRIEVALFEQGNFVDLGTMDDLQQFIDKS